MPTKCPENIDKPETLCGWVHSVEILLAQVISDANEGVAGTFLNGDELRRSDNDGIAPTLLEELETEALQPIEGILQEQVQDIPESELNIGGRHDVQGRAPWTIALSPSPEDYVVQRGAETDVRVFRAAPLHHRRVLGQVTARNAMCDALADIEAPDSDVKGDEVHSHNINENCYRLRKILGVPSVVHIIGGMTTTCAM